MKIAITGDLYLNTTETITIDTTLKSILKSCDYRIFNLEGPITKSSDNNAPLKSGPLLKQSESVICVLQELNADMLTLANNHMMDYGERGFRETQDILKGRYDLIGCGSLKEAYKLHVIVKDNLRIGFLNFCEMQFGMLYECWTQKEETVGCAWVNHPEVDDIIRRSKSQVDILIAICHCGVEMVDVPLPEWRDRYRRMIDLGCNAIIGHHPHVVQGYEIYKECPICYSLGNFCFGHNGDGKTKDWSIGALALLTVEKTGVIIDTIGVRMKENKHIIVLPKEEWDEYVAKRNSLLLDNNYMSRVNEACQRLMEDYQYIFSMGGLFSADKYWLKNLARIVLKRYNHVHLLNNLQCESHRWCICRALRLEQPNIN